ncbi:c-type cytochrome [Mesorhizobium sp.]|uniref:c-type cytochrome n=1 Tax=Mesorhizobium sp. TaxID=1871066 RepID=UPI000FE5B1BD|nr:c-type cytochrome [Mesorhizobium sp.]RWE79563.1 MAG: c-type cytochrome [Mesorhizobium sp.]
MSRLHLKAALFALTLFAAPHAMADGDATKGQSLFSRCSACHSTNSTNKVGPGLGGVVGRRSGTVAGFKYSPAMTAANLTWDDGNLDAFLKSPPALVKGTRMAGIAIAKDQDRADIIAYLKTLAP